jgi:hypothetical protein
MQILRPDVAMQIRRVASFLIFLPMLVTPCFAHHMAVVVNKDNKIGNMAAVELAKIFRSETKKWLDGKSGRPGFA